MILLANISKLFKIKMQIAAIISWSWSDDHVQCYSLCRTQETLQEWFPNREIQMKSTPSSTINTPSCSDHNYTAPREADIYPSNPRTYPVFHYPLMQEITVPFYHSWQWSLYRSSQKCFFIHRSHPVRDVIWRWLLRFV